MNQDKSIEGLNWADLEVIRTALVIHEAKEKKLHNKAEKVQAEKTRKKVQETIENYEGGNNV